MNHKSTTYDNFSTDDFVTDPFFKEWVLFSDPAHEEFWNTWKKANPSKVKLLEEAKELVLKLEKSKFAMDSNELLSVWGAIQADIKHPSQKLKLSSRKRNFWPFASAVASIVFALLVWYWYEMPKEIEYQTAFGETREIVLPDGSNVILNSNSKLTFVNDWEDQTAREIRIEGEAFFSVVHKTDHQPFRVFSSQNVAIEVLGTEFNVYNRSQETEVVLASGLVTLSFPVKEKEGKILMKPGELVEFKASKFQRKQVNTAHYTSWKDKVLHLDETSLEEIIKMARNNYGIEIDVQDQEVLKQTASGSMPLSDAANFMEQISKIFNIEIENEQNKYLIK
ncbi:ferric-dicitrate binding protein FerR (iron transport regulator) [Algoriphagus sp. 4150]|uniref:FecR family protein n=1 Tax=Algoriphagus sp. 4150 TaxID=2817756 RepID=UPI00285C4088|nr:FecR domain-containing protein [Algoriphagus sp. 4150]MDR7132119.1 ferric-dicitrate binding protein FerR (iron transport regulator) [Algoriphagus sp. 4150]